MLLPGLAGWLAAAQGGGRGRGWEQRARGNSGVPHSGHGRDAEHGNTLGCLFILNPLRAESGATGHKEKRLPPVGKLIRIKYFQCRGLCAHVTYLVPKATLNSGC